MNEEPLHGFVWKKNDFILLTTVICKRPKSCTVKVNGLFIVIDQNINER